MESPEAIREALAQHICTEQHWVLSRLDILVRSAVRDYISNCINSKDLLLHVFSYDENSH